MKLLGKFCILIFLVIVVFGGILYFWKPKVEERGTKKVIFKASFNNSEELGQWDQKSLSKKDTVYSIAEYKGRNCVKAEAADSASALFYEKRLTSEDDLYISWEWIVSKFPTFDGKENIGKKKEFDFAAQVYIVFYSRFFLKTRAIQYVWTKDIPVGMFGSSPYTKNVKIFVLRSGEAASWEKESRNIRSDYEMLFGQKLDKDISAIAFMSDSDSTSTEVIAYFSNFEIGYLEDKD